MFIDYSLIFILLCFVLMIVTVLRLFDKNMDFNQTMGALIISLINFILCFITAASFYAVNFPGYDSSGLIVDNVDYNYYPFVALFACFAYLNCLFIGYCFYIFYKKPWDDKRDDKEAFLYRQ